uniref:Rx N-terminal domain-containing protein n=1 Tax=Oryza barthii TaxID=65489 RepID=A0A0D3F408_9ORYZ
MDQAAGGAQGIVLSVGQLLGEEYRQLRGVGGEVAQLRDELATMNALFRMQSEAGEGSVDHFVREWMRQVREVAYDAEDCVDLYVCRCRVSRWTMRDGVLSWARQLASTLFPRRRLAGDIKALRARAIEISERHARYGVNREELRGCTASAAALVPATAAAFHPAACGSDQLVGIEGQANTLADKLKAVDESSNLKGRRRWPWEVCRKLESVFQRQAMVSVSQAFDSSKDLQVLLKRILVQVVTPKRSNDNSINEEQSTGDIDRMDVSTLFQKLEGSLTGMRYLIVIDDVWSTSAWNAIQSKLQENNCGSIIMVTTRIETVAKASSSPSVSGDYMHKINPLGEKDAEKLFVSRAFGSKESCCPEDLKEQMKSILKKCAGLPLAIVSIAGLLSSYRSSSSGSIRMWRRISNSIGSQMEIHPTLEGMKQIIALSYNHLPHHLKACMLYLSIFPEDYVIKKKRLLLRWIAEGFVMEKRGLTLFEVAESYYDELLFLLRFLSLRNTNVSTIPRQISRLQHLQTLNLYGTRIEKLPTSVTMLERLEYLFFSNRYTRCRWKIPVGLERMMALRTLRTICLPNDPNVVKEIGALSQLQTLDITIDNSNEEVLANLADALDKTNNLRSLYAYGTGKDEHKDRLLNFLLRLKTPPLLLESVRIDGVMDQLPKWFNSLVHLVKIQIWRVSLTGDQLLGVLCELPNLASVSLAYGSCTDDELLVRSAFKFPALKSFYVDPCTTPRAIRFEKPAMEKVETFKVIFRDNDGSGRPILAGIENLTSLKKLEVLTPSKYAEIEILERLNVESARHQNKFEVAVIYLW